MELQEQGGEEAAEDPLPEEGTEHAEPAPIAEATAKKLWGGRFTGETDPLMHKYNQSLSYDQRMWREDIDGSVVYAKALQAQGIITQQELDSIKEGLEEVGKEWDQGTFQVAPNDEDIHTANERRLVQ